MPIKPGLFGINKSNRNFTDKENWGKNKFNSSFPVSLMSYLHSKGLENIYLELNKDLKVVHNVLSAESLFGINPDSENLFWWYCRNGDNFLFYIRNINMLNIVISPLLQHYLYFLHLKVLIRNMSNY